MSLSKAVGIISVAFICIYYYLRNSLTNA